MIYKWYCYLNKSVSKEYVSQMFKQANTKNVTDRQQLNVMCQPANTVDTKRKILIALLFAQHFNIALVIQCQGLLRKFSTVSKTWALEWQCPTTVCKLTKKIIEGEVSEMLKIFRILFLWLKISLQNVSRILKTRINW